MFNSIDFKESDSLKGHNALDIFRIEIISSIRYKGELKTFTAEQFTQFLEQL